LVDFLGVRPTKVVRETPLVKPTRLELLAQFLVPLKGSL
jgi:hypothetical protein